MSSIVTVLVLGEAADAAVPVIWLLLIPMVLDWVLEHAGRISYSPRRQVIVSLAAGIGGGMALAIHAQEPFNLPATLPVAATATVCIISAAFSTKTPDRSGQDLAASGMAPSGLPGGSDGSDLTSMSEDCGWLRLHQIEEAERTARLVGLLAEPPAEALHEPLTEATTPK